MTLNIINKFQSLVYNSIVCVLLYHTTPDVVEKEMAVPVYTVNNAQYIQFTSPYDTSPTIVNVNRRFSRKFYEGEAVRVLIISRGPYNGMYDDIEPRIELITPPDDCNYSEPTLAPIPIEI